MVVGARLAGQKLLIYWDFATQTSLGFTENGLEKASYLVLFYVRGQMRMGSLKLMGRQQQLKQPLVTATVCRRAATR